MRITSIGGGPAGLYFAILMKKARPQASIKVLERNRAEDTFGWGVVFSDETLDNIRAADPETYAEIERSFIHWTDIQNFYGDQCVTSTGHGFSGLARKRLLEILQQRCQAVGVELHFETEVDDVEALRADCDLLLGADGLNSVVRETYSQHFSPNLDWRRAKFCWLGTDLELDAFTFIFEENEHGLFQVHAYPFQKGLSTFIVECDEDSWRAAGLDQADEAQTVEYFERLYAPYLKGAKLLTNRSIWRTFPTVKNESWSHGNVVLVGDSAHTAHFSIGSGTKLAMEDSIALAEALLEHTQADSSQAQLATAIPEVLEAYEEARRLDVIKTQKAAQTSLEWFEHSRRYMGQDPVLFAFNLMTRSKRITYDNLALRDPELVNSAKQRFAELNGWSSSTAGEVAPEPMFLPYQARGLQLSNRMVVSPMCQYSAVDGVPNDWHFVHLGSRAVGGAGLVLTEMTNVSAQGRITHGCAGMYNDAQTEAWKRVVDFVHAHSSGAIGMQLAHAGRKASCHLPWEGDRPLTDDTSWPTQGPSALPFGDDWPTPHEMTRADLLEVLADFEQATRRCVQAGFDWLELHMAHGYLLSSFLSPAANQRSDEFGGDLKKRMRFPLEVFEAVRAIWPEERPMSVRISATDWLEHESSEALRGTTLDDSIVLAKELETRGLDVVDVSSAGNTPRSRPIYGRMYQVPFAERIRYETNLGVMAVGAIQGADHANTLLTAGRADLCALARPHLLNPQLTLEAAARYGNSAQPWPKQYEAVRPRKRR